MNVEVIRSPRRTRTISAVVRGNTVVVTIPARMSTKDEQEWVRRMVDRVERARRKGQRHRDEDLASRAQELNQRHFDGKLTVTGIIYVDNQRTLYGSCTPSTGLIRISRRLSELPRWVEDYVIMHELSHLVYSHHGPRFWDVVNRYPLAERARGYLMALGFAEDESSESEEEAS